MRPMTGSVVWNDGEYQRRPLLSRKMEVQTWRACVRSRVAMDEQVRVEYSQASNPTTLPASCICCSSLNRLARRISRVRTPIELRCACFPPRWRRNARSDAAKQASRQASPTQTSDASREARSETRIANKNRGCLWCHTRRICGSAMRDGASTGRKGKSTSGHAHGLSPGAHVMIECIVPAVSMPRLWIASVD